MDKSNVKPEDIPNIINAINKAIAGLGYVAIGYDNSDVFLNVVIDKANDWEEPHVFV